MDNTEPKYNNPLLEKIRMPGETFRLPSGGLFYENKNILADSVKNGEVHVLPMTAFDEILMKTPDKLFSGAAVKEVFSRCIPDILQPDLLLSKDVDFLMLCLRKMSYGPEVTVEYTHDCSNAKKHTYSFDISTIIRDSKNIDPTIVNKTYVIVLENGQVVHLKPINFIDYVKIMQTFDQDLDEVIAKEQFIDSIACIIDSVDDVFDVGMIREWIDQVPVKWIHKINESVEKTNDWGPDFKFVTKCRDCGAEIKLSPPLNPISFFI